ncbi:hypothetical protein ACIP9H_34140 [Streptomyces sp. NPDC088732]|uniref:hypothetical protein n=1 Tax=Streptomyces sp. NPDC088732 TaxID=3365879 RepID=UPI003824627B
MYAAYPANADRAATAYGAARDGSNHPESRRVPVASAKAGRQVINAYAAATRHDPAQQRVKGREMADEMIGDFLGDLFHFTAAWSSSGAVLRAHKRRAQGDHLMNLAPEIRAAVFAVGNVLSLAAAYGLDTAELIGRAMDAHAYEVSAPQGE